MLVFAKAPLNAAQSSGSQILRVSATRALHASRRTCYAQDSSDAGPAVTKTKKSYSELSRTRLSSDGTPLTPLGPWTGGLEPSGAVRLETSSVEHDMLEKPDSRDVIPEVDIIATEAKKRHSTRTKLLEMSTSQLDVSTKPARKRRVKLVTKDNDGLELAFPITGTELDEPVTRRKTAKRGQSSKGPSNKDQSLARQPRNQLAVEILENLSKFPHCILLTRVGQFYESYFDQAANVARLLNIKLTQRTWDGHRILMCGFPLMHLDKYLKVLVQQHKQFVALCEEFPRNSALGAAGGFDRRVVRVVTPGTLIDEPFLNQYENNYLLAVGETSSPMSDGEDSLRRVGLAWMDVSTGEFFTKNTNHEGLRDELVRLNPKEVVLVKRLDDDPSHPVGQIVAEEAAFVSYADPQADAIIPSTTTIPSDDAASSDEITAQTSPSSLLETPVFSDCETAAIQLLTSYLHANLLEHMPRLLAPSKEADQGRMRIDAHTLKSLEIREGMREGGTTGSLISVVKRTVTSGGTRLLARWLCSPSTSIKEIVARQSLVAFFHARPHLRADLVEALSTAEDATRIVQKFLSGRGDASDLVAINGTVGVWAVIKERIALEKDMEMQEHGDIQAVDWSSLDALMARMSGLQELSERITAALQQTEPAKIGVQEGEVDNQDQVDGLPQQGDSSFYGAEKWTIRPQFSEHLSGLHATYHNLLASRSELERELQLSFDAPSLTLRSSRNHGMHVHLARGKRDGAKLKESIAFVKISESGTTSSWFNREWSILGGKIVDTAAAIFSAERETFESLRVEVNSYSDRIRRNARILDELDVTLAFANLALEMNFVRPELRDDTTYHVVNGRHPTVELGLLTDGRMFTPNTVSFSPDSRLHIITGPNMAGKSTLLRQTALIAILAQVGSFVPADAAVVGIIDQLFSRVGAKDDLFRDRSTFMVEMLETAEILRRATSNSLVIMDEVGRGTTVKDGLAIAFSAVNHLHSVNRCRVLFATHFHELADLLGYEEGPSGGGHFRDVAFFCTDVEETGDGHFSYSHRLRPGVNRDSHGLKVAQLAGMPQPAIGVAKYVLEALRAGDGVALDKSSLRTLGQSIGDRERQ